MKQHKDVFQRDTQVFLLVKSLVVILGLSLCKNLDASPELSQIVNGDVNIAAQLDGLQINQNSQKAILDWRSFNIQAQEHVHFQQPANGICLNRIDSTQGMSQIHGQLSATGKIFLINEAGILFGENSKVNVGGIVASAIGISNENFLSDRFVFDQGNDLGGSIINRGVINVADQGLAVFLGSSVANPGMIHANMSKVVLASGKKFTLDFYGDGVLNFGVDEATITPGRDENNNALPEAVSVAGTVISDAGEIIITGRAAQNVFNDLINMDGTIRATSVVQKEGKILLLGDDAGAVNIRGQLDVTGVSPETKGGNVHVLGTKVAVQDGAVINASGAKGGGEILIGGDYKGANSAIKNATNTTIAPEAKLISNATDNGDGGKIVVWSDDTTGFYGSTHAKGGALGGNGGFVEISGRNNLFLGDLPVGALDTTAPKGNLGNVLFDPRYLVVATTGGSAYAAGTNNLFANNVGSTNTITPASIVAAASNVTLQANTDVVFTNALAMTTSGATLTVNAGRSVLFNANVSTTNAAITVTANDTNATSSDRNTTSTGNPAGDTETTAGNITAAAGVSVSSGTGALSMSIGSSSSAPFSPGSINLDTITGGAITLTSPNAVNVNTSIAQSTSLDITIGAASTINAVVSGAGNFNFHGTNTLAFNATNTYTGTTTVSGGVLSVDGDRSFGAVPGATTPGSIVLSGGTILATAAVNLSNRRGISTDITGGTIAANSGITWTGNSIIAGTGPLTIGTASATGTVIFAAANTYTGATTLNGGTLQTNTANALANSTSFTLSATNTCNFNMNNTAQTVNNLSGGSSATVGAISLGNSTLTIDQTTDGTYSGVISGTGNLLLSNLSTNRLTLTNTNSYAGITTINGGILSISQDLNLGAAPGSANATEITFGGGTLETTGNFTLASTRGVTLNAGGVISATSGTTLTYGGIITGANPMTYSGAGKVVLSGTSTYTGITNISNGTVSISGDRNLGAVPGVATAGSITFANGTLATTGTFALSSNRGIATGIGATIAPATGTTLTYGGIIAGSGPVTLADAGTLILSGTSTYTGATNINAGTLQTNIANAIANTSALVMSTTTASTFNLNSNNQTVGSLSGGSSATIGNINLGSATLSINQTAGGLYGGVISGTGNLLLTSSSTNKLTLTNANNSYAGITTINGGTLSISADSMLGTVPGSPNATEITMGGGTLETTANFTLATNRGMTLNTGGGTLSATSGTTLNYSGVITGSNAMTYSGAGKVVVGGSNTYSGTTTINNGTLSIAADNNLGVAPGSPTAGSLVFGAGTLQATQIFALSPNRGITLNAGGGTISTDPIFALTYNGIIAGTGAFTKAGGGTLILGGTNTYTGVTNITAGTLQATLANIIASSSSVVMSNVAGAILDLNSFNQSIGTLSGGGTNGGNISLGTATLTVTQSSDATYAGVISGTGGLTKGGSSLLNLASTNTYTGTTTINAGTLQAGAANVISSSSPVTLANTAGAIFDLNSFNQSVGTLSGGGASGGNITLGTATLTVNQGSDATYSGVISGTGGLTKAGSNALTLAGTNIYTGTTTINAGTLRAGVVNAISSSSPFVMANVAGAIFDLNNFNQSINTLEGGGSTGGNITLGSATLTVVQGSDQTYAGIISGTGSLIKSGSRTLTLAGANTYGGSTTINAGTLQAGVANAIPNGSAVTLANTSTAVLALNNFNQSIGTLSGGGIIGGNISLGSATLTVTQGSDATYAGVISGTGGLTLSSSSTNSLTLSAANTYSGDTTVNGGVLSISSDANLGSVPGSATAASIVLNGGTLATTTPSFSLSANRGITLGSSGGTMQTDASPFILTYNGVITGSGALTKTGTGTLLLGGTNTYSGVTNLNVGTIKASAANVMPSGSAMTLANTAGVTFDLNNFNQSIATLSGGGTTGGNITLGSATLTVNQGANATYSGVISGSGGLTKAGSSGLTLSGINTYTGTTTINAGTLQAGAANVIYSVSPLAFANTSGAIFDLNNFNQSVGGLSGGGTTGGNISLGNATLTVTQGANATYAGVISGTGGLTKAGSSQLTLSGTNTYTGTTTINADTLQAGAANVIASSSAVTLANTAGVIFDLNNFNQTINTLSGGGTSGGNINLGSATLTVTQGSDQTYAGVISGTGGLTKAGSNTLTLSGVSTYSGVTNISAGKLQAGVANILLNSTALTLANVAGAVFDLNSFNQEISSLSGGGTTGGNITLGSATLTVDQLAAGTYSGVISGTGGFTLSNASTQTLVLAGTNTYSGGTTINGNTLSISNDNNLGAVPGLATAGNITFGGGTLGVTAGITIATNRGIALGSGGTIQVDPTFTVNYGGIMAGSGAFTKTGSGTLALSGTNTYTGATNINAGTLQAGAANIISSSSAVTMANVAGAILDLNGFNQAINSLSGGGTNGGNITLGSATLTVTQNSDATYAGVISGAGGLTKAGSSLLDLAGVNTYTGTTTINSGILQVGVANAISTSSPLVLANVAGAGLDLNDFNQSISTLSGGGASGGNIILGSGTITVNQAADATYSGVISGTGGLTKAGGNTLTLAGVNTYTGTTTINSGILRAGVVNAISNSSPLTLANVLGASFDLNNFNQNINTLEGGGSTGGNISLGSATLTVVQGADQTYAGVISGTGSLIKSGARTLTLSGSNSYGGRTTINAGTLLAGAANVIPSGSAVTLANTGTAALDLNNFNQSIGTLSGGGTGGGNISLGNATLSVTQGSDQTYAGVISGSGGIILASASTNILTLSGANTYTGATSINGGTLQAGATDVIASSSSVTLANNAATTFDLNGFNQSINQYIIRRWRYWR